MRKIKWFHLTLLIGGILSGFFLKSLLYKNDMSDWWLVPFIALFFLAYIRIDLKKDSDE